MTSTSMRKPMMAALGLAGTLFLAVAGCGGKGGQDETAVVVPPPEEISVASGAASAAPAGGSPASATKAASASPGTAAPAENVKAEGWGTLKGQITFDSAPPQPKVLVEKGKA